MKNKKMKSIKYESSDTKEVRNLIFIVLGIAVVLVGLYFLTARSIKRQNNANITFDYNICTVGTMFNRPYEEYYVFLYGSDNEKASTYKSLATTYAKKEGALKIYTVDLNANLDNKYLSDSSNTKPTKSSEVKIKDSALVHIKNGQVVNYYETASDYEKVLK